MYADSIISGWKSSYTSLVKSVVASSSFQRCLFEGNIHDDADEGGIIASSGAKFAPVRLENVTFLKNTYNFLLWDSNPDCCDGRPTFFSDQSLVVGLEDTDDYATPPFLLGTTTTSPLSLAPASKFISMASGPIRSTIQVCFVCQVPRVSIYGSCLLGCNLPKPRKSGREIAHNELFPMLLIKRGQECVWRKIQCCAGCAASSEANTEWNAPVRSCAHVSANKNISIQSSHLLSNQDAHLLGTAPFIPQQGVCRRGRRCGVCQGLRPCICTRVRTH